jgi:HEAT repeat protein
MRQVSLKRILLALAPVLAVIVVGYYVTHPPEPLYSGRSLSQWKADLDESKPVAVRRRAEVMLIQAAQEAAPDLMKALQTKDSPLRGEIVFWANKMGLNLKSAAERRRRAMSQFRLFDQGAIPVLANLLRHPELAVDATRMLNGLGLAAVEPLIGALQHTNEIVRQYAAAGLGDCQLNHRMGLVKGPFPTNAVVAALVRCLKDPVPNVQIAAAHGLGRMEEQSAVVVPVLMETLEETDSPYVQIAAAQALGRLGKEASSAVVQLKELCRSKDLFVRLTAEEALQKIRD